MEPWVERRRTSSSGYTPRPFNSLAVDSDYQRDRARVIHSSAFRRLQSKTQVLGIGESDFYRTRLTHSLEVAQIGSGICEALRQKYCEQEACLAWIPSLSLIEAICLCHDIGHPPFGHGGEVALNHMMDRHGGFEGNGQTLRIIARLGEYSPAHGLDLTRRVMLGVLKYPVLYSQVRNFPPTLVAERGTTNIDAWAPPKCLLDDDAEVLDWILRPLSETDRTRFTTIEKRQGRHHRSVYKSFDTSIMDIADDIAYGVHDLEDALAMRLVDLSQWQQQVAEPVLALSDCPIAEEMAFYNAKLFSGSNKDRKHAISKLVGYLVSHIEIDEDHGFEHPLLRYQARMRAPASEVLRLLKAFILKNVIKRPEVQALEYKGQQMILRLFEVLSDNPGRLLPYDVQETYEQADNRPRVISDHIAGMTDNHATKLYHKLFTPNMGSVFDRV